MIKNFIIKKINRLLIKNLNTNIKTRFAPEPSGFLHLGHLKCIYINYIIKKIYNGIFFLRLDDSDPNKKRNIFSKKIIIYLKKSINFFYYSSEKFYLLYNFTKKIINLNKCYIDSQNKKNFKINKGNFLKKGNLSIFYKRSVKENLYIFKKMKKYKEKEMVLRFRLNIKSSNIILRDPVIYRIKKNITCPTYDFINSILDRIDKVTYSICSKEFEHNRILYNFYIKLYNKIKKKQFFPIQIEFSKLNIKKFNLSKRKINNMLRKKKISYFDPRLLTLEGLKNRGFNKKILLNFIKKNQYSKSENFLKIDELKKEAFSYFSKIKKIKILKKKIKIKKKKIIFFIKKQNKFKNLNNKNKKPVFLIFFIKKIKFFFYEKFKKKKRIFFLKNLKKKRIIFLNNIGIFKKKNKSFYEIVKNKPGFV
ncbi:glutamate--tRNA ligase family protein [Candidatus Vidania fulgoroideorum]